MQEAELLETMSSAFEIRRQLAISNAQLTFSVALCMNELNYLFKGEKVRIFYEYKSYLYYRKMFIEDILSS